MLRKISKDGKNIYWYSFCSGEFECSSDVTVLTSKEILIESVGYDIQALLFICSLLEEFKKKYNYGFKWSLDRMKLDELRLPINSNNKLDFSLL